MWGAYLETKMLPFMSDDQNTKPLVPSPGVTQRLLPTRVGGVGGEPQCGCRSSHARELGERYSVRPVEREVTQVGESGNPAVVQCVIVEDRTGREVCRPARWVSQHCTTPRREGATAYPSGGTLTAEESESPGGASERLKSLLPAG